MAGEKAVKASPVSPIVRRMAVGLAPMIDPSQVNRGWEESRVDG